MSGFFSGSFAPSWPHAVLLAVAIVASFAVAIGIVMENPKWSLPNALVVGGVAIEAVCTLLLFGFDEGISRAQQSKIIALETQIAPRSLTKEQFDAIQSLKGRVAAINIAVENDSECEIFVGILLGALTDAGIKVEGIYSLPLDMRGKSGLVVYDQDFSEHSAGKAISETLTNAGLGIGFQTSRLPNALDMPRDVPAILVYEKLYSIPSDRPFSYSPPPIDQANPVPAK